MDIVRSKLSERQFAVLRLAQSKKDVIQVQLDALQTEYQNAMKVVNEVGDKIRMIKPSLVPYSKMMAGIASVNSRNKYYPKFLGASDNEEMSEDFLIWVEANL